ncbi:hypothetical protein PPERSA_12726 [Pseudocohnilembus persalinus]|uniref:Uncharacterized protein n=1 Tax=Pseudocohnilembus persalinus TaxID=266149 RepID=A0A0V0QTA3_PSEPJ|nr:hypothetical protein PPERSA_12726 [Pseudocohnilembus persalinus]|eukprot:KRX05548.1 hypothetical protein PPERSA_12726 [Pseudocohnilembus persalinus]
MRKFNAQDAKNQQYILPGAGIKTVGAQNQNSFNQQPQQMNNRNLNSQVNNNFNQQQQQQQNLNQMQNQGQGNQQYNTQNVNLNYNKTQATQNPTPNPNTINQNTFNNKLPNQFSVSREQIQQGLQNGGTTNFNFAQENEKLRQKLQNLEQIVNFAQGFEQTQNVIDMKNFAQLNQQKFSDLIDELYQVKQQLEEEKQKKKSDNDKILSDQKLGEQPTIQELQKQLQEAKNEKQQLRDKLNGLGEFSDREQMIEQINNQNETIQQLSDEVNELSTKNQEYLENIRKKDFFKEYEKNLKEVEGLRKQNQLVNEQLSQVKKDLAAAQGKPQLPGFAPGASRMLSEHSTD